MSARRQAAASGPAWSSPSPAASPRRPEPRSGRHRARLSRFLPVVALLLAALSPFAVMPASADVLVSNIEQTSGTYPVLYVVGLTIGFTTGAHPHGYDLSSIEVPFSISSGTVIDHNEIRQLKAELWSATTAGAPNAKLVSLTVPSNLTAGRVTLTFAAPEGTYRLNPSTTYHAVVYYLGASVLYAVGYAGSGNEDPPGDAEGWSIADSGYYDETAPRNNGPWKSSGYAMRIRVNGSLVPPRINLRVTPGDRRLTMRWTAPDLPRLTVLTGYEVQYREAVCTKPRRAGTAPNDYPVYQGNVPEYVHCDAANPNQPGPWIDHGAWAGSSDPIARQTTRVIDGLIPSVVYDVRVRAKTFRCTQTENYTATIGGQSVDKVRCRESGKVHTDWEYVSARGTPSGGRSNARLHQLTFQPQR